MARGCAQVSPILAKSSSSSLSHMPDPRRRKVAQPCLTRWRPWRASLWPSAWTRSCAPMCVMIWLPTWQARSRTWRVRFPTSSLPRLARSFRKVSAAPSLRPRLSSPSVLLSTCSRRSRSTAGPLRVPSISTWMRRTLRPSWGATPTPAGSPTTTTFRHSATPMRPTRRRSASIPLTSRPKTRCSGRSTVTTRICAPRGRTIRSSSTRITWACSWAA
ncbi:Uncharacterised protein [Collinsella intestinalis]|nr:Uncharacterised protein [Collinsella intestinalis]